MHYKQKFAQIINLVLPKNVHDWFYIHNINNNNNEITKKLPNIYFYGVNLLF